MDIIEGKFYKTRNNVKVGPVYRDYDEDGPMYWKAPTPEIEGWGENYMAAWYPDGSYYSNRIHENDLVSEWVETWTPENDGIGETERTAELIIDPAVVSLGILAVPKEKLMTIFIAMKEASQTIEHDNVRNTYTKGPFYCVYTDLDQVIKYPVADIWRVTEDYSTSN